MINEELTEIFKVKGKAQFPKIYRIYDQDCIFYFSLHIFRISIHHHAMATNVTNLQRHPLLFRVQSLALLQLRFWDSLFSISSSSSLTSISSSITSILSTSAGQFSGVFEFLLFDSGGFLLMSPTCSVTNKTYFCKEPYFTKEKHLNPLKMILYTLLEYTLTITKYNVYRRSVNNEQTTGFHQIWLKQNDKYSSRNLLSLINLKYLLTKPFFTMQIEYKGKPVLRRQS